MNPDKQRIAIAEARGNKPHTTGALGVPRWIMSDHEAGDIGDGVIYRDDLPDYLNDLNAMHEALKTQPIRIQQKYIPVLRNLCAVEGSWPEEATAAQRAEAFLRTLAKWEEDK